MACRFGQHRNWGPILWTESFLAQLWDRCSGGGGSSTDSERMWLSGQRFECGDHFEEVRADVGEGVAGARAGAFVAGVGAGDGVAEFAFDVGEGCVA